MYKLFIYIHTHCKIFKFNIINLEQFQKFMYEYFCVAYKLIQQNKFKLLKKYFYKNIFMIWNNIGNIFNKSKIGIGIGSETI